MLGRQKKKEQLRILPGALLEAAVELGTIQMLKEHIRKNPPEVKMAVLDKIRPAKKKSASSFIEHKEE